MAPIQIVHTPRFLGGRVDPSPPLFRRYSQLRVMHSNISKETQCTSDLIVLLPNLFVLRSFDAHVDSMAYYTTLKPFPSCQ